MKNKAAIYLDGFEIRKHNIRIEAVLIKDIWIVNITRFSKEVRTKASFDEYIERMRGVLTVKKIVLYEEMFNDLANLLNYFYDYKSKTK